ncbi:MAG: type IV pilus assembly protein PilM [Candidatus Paceibacterota bacterium]
MLKLNFITNFFQDITNLFKSSSVLGVDIGTNSIKVSEVTNKDQFYVLKNYGLIKAKDYLIHSNHSLQTSSLSIVESEATRLLKIILSEMKTKSRTAVVSIPTFTSFTTLIDMPDLSDKETSQSISFQAKQYIPVPEDQVLVDWMKLETYTNPSGQKMQKVLLIGIPKNIIEGYKRVFKNAGIKLVALELDAIATSRAFSHIKEPSMIIDIGAGSTLISIIENGVLRYVGQTDYSGAHITRAVSKSLDLSMLRAEDLKRRRGLGGKTLESELSSLILPFLDVIIQEVEHTKKMYEKRYGKIVKNFSITGGGARLDGINSYFAQRMEITYFSPNIFVGFDYNKELEPAIKILQKELSVSIGVAKRYFQN